MTQPIYPNFLVDEREYAASEQFWHDLVVQVVSELGTDDQWRAWRPRAYVNGLPFEKDGNPIFDVLNEQIRRAVQIIQWPAEGSDLEISGWVSDVHVPLGNDEVTIPELTINLSLSIESAAIARELLTKWLDPAEDIASIKELMATLTRSNGLE